MEPKPGERFRFQELVLIWTGKPCPVGLFYMWTRSDQEWCSLKCMVRRLWGSGVEKKLR